MIHRGLSCVLQTFGEIAPGKFPITARRAMPTPLPYCPTKSLPNLVKAPIMISCRRHASKNPSSAIKNQIICLVNLYQAKMPGNVAHGPTTQRKVPGHLARLDAYEMLMENLTSRKWAREDEQPTELQLCRNSGQRMTARLVHP